MKLMKWLKLILIIISGILFFHAIPAVWCSIFRYFIGFESVKTLIRDIFIIGGVT